MIPIASPLTVEGLALIPWESGQGYSILHHNSGQQVLHTLTHPRAIHCLNGLLTLPVDWAKTPLPPKRRLLASALVDYFERLEN